MGFLTLGRRFLNNTHDIIDDRIDVVTRGLMGLTVTLCPLPRPQVRPDPDGRLLLALRRVRRARTEPKELPLIEEVKRTPEVIAFEKEVEKREADYRPSSRSGTRRT